MGPGNSQYGGSSLTWKARSTILTVIIPAYLLEARVKEIRWLVVPVAEYTIKHLETEKLKSHKTVLAKTYQIKDSFVCFIIT